MKYSCLLYALLLWGTVSFCHAQPRVTTKPLIIQGQLTHCTESYLILAFENEYGITEMDTIPVDSTGRFYLKTFKVAAPTLANIQKHATQINDLFVAPGYELTITGDATNYKTLLASKKITGKGAESNRFQLLLDSILYARNDTIGWYDKQEADLLAYVADFKKLRDSLAGKVFNHKSVNDPYLEYFGKVVRTNNKLAGLYFLMVHTEIRNLDYHQTQAFIKQHFDTTILNNLFVPEYMLSPMYTNWLMSAQYLSHSERLEKLQHPDAKLSKYYKLDKILTTYKGAIKQLVLYRQLTSQIGKCKTFEDTKDFKNKMAVYLEAVQNPVYTQQLDTRLAERTAELVRTQIGKPAPAFTLPSNNGKTWSLSDFKGKVVYMDLWASWCGPCRAETPALKALYSKYKNNDSLAIISISVSDGKKEWEKALAEDKPEWLQLLDADNVVGKTYVARFIPQFVLIDKQGNMVSNSAPMPSKAEELEQLLAQELAK